MIVGNWIFYYLIYHFDPLRSKIKIRDIEYIDVIIDSVERDMRGHIGAMSLVDTPCGDSGKTQEYEIRLKYLYKFKGVDYLTHDERMERLRNYIEWGFT